MSRTLSTVEFELAQNGWYESAQGEDHFVWATDEHQDVSVYVYADDRWEVAFDDSDATEPYASGVGVEDLISLLHSELQEG